MRIEISHQSTYNYDQPVHVGMQQLRLTPTTGAGQHVVTWQTSLEGATQELEFVDHNMNHVRLISFIEGETSIGINTSGVVETTDTAGIVAPDHENCPRWLFQRSTDLTIAGPRITDLVTSMSNGSLGDVAQLHQLSELVRSAVEYRTGDTDVAFTAEEALALGNGVCQDHSHIFLSGARLLGYPARYVSGYLVIDDQIDQEATHAWAEVAVPDLGWVGFDISNGIAPDERYVRLATGLDYKEAAPISGIRFGSANEELSVMLQVQQ